MKIELNGRRAVVCGSTQGIGRAVAQQLAEAGAAVTLVARRAETLEEVRCALPAAPGGEHRVVVADFQHPDRLDQAIRDEVVQFPAEILINNSGGPPGGPITTATVEAFEAAFAQHLICNHLLVQALLPHMRQQKFGRVINVISTSVKQPLDRLGVSNTIRGAVANWAKTLANELGPEGITVNNVLPGATATGRLSSIIDSQAEARGVTAEDVSEAMKNSIPARRFADPEEIGYAVTFLSSVQAGYINGINLPVDGGRTKCL